MSHLVNSLTSASQLSSLYNGGDTIRLFAWEGWQDATEAQFKGPLGKGYLS